jgi:hypothetical protein
MLEMLSKNDEDEHEVDQVVKSIFAATNKSSKSQLGADEKPKSDSEHDEPANIEEEEMELSEKTIVEELNEEPAAQEIAKKE